MNTAKIYKRALLQYRSMGTKYDFGFMHELRGAGAPILGTFNPRPDLENYKWYVEPTSDYIIVSWEKIILCGGVL